MNLLAAWTVSGWAAVLAVVLAFGVGCVVGHGHGAGGHV